MSLIEIMLAMAVLALVMMGVIAGLISAAGATGHASRRTQMLNLAQARCERLMGLDSLGFQTLWTQLGSKTAASPSPILGAFGAAPGQGGWTIDADPAAAGDDLMAGPVVKMNGTTQVDAAGTTALRAQVLADTTGKGCALSSVAGDPTVLCREIYIESDATTLPPSYLVWVRVLHGGTASSPQIVSQVYRP